MTSPAGAAQAWLQLLHAKGVPLAVKRAMVGALGSPEAVLAADQAGLREALGEDAPRNLPTRWRYPDVTPDLDALARSGAEFIGFTAPDYPPLLNQIPDAPLGLFALGRRELLGNPQLAVVGSRSPTPSGRRTTEQFAGELSALGLTVTSGLALGIDAAAHRGCLAADGDTIAVTATGIDHTYPRGNAELRGEIISRGLVVSEYAPGTPPCRQHFPRRNRIISGLALGTLVVEAGIRSGSLITARLAGEQNREVFAVPGSIHSPASRGCHSLLRQGAKLVETSADILEEIGQFFPAHLAAVAATVDTTPAAATDPPDEFAHLHNLIDYHPVSIDQLIQQSGLTADRVSYILMELEIKGFIAAATGGYQRLPR